MKRKIMALGAVLAWVCGVFGATHEGVQLWENGPLWAKTNIGANSPTEAGYYFWWGDTLGYKWQNNQWVASDGSVSGYSFEPADIPTNGKSLAQLQSMGVVNADGNLQPAYDAAARQWGDDWRMPKVSELNNLRDLCSWNWTTNNGVVGYTVTGKGLYSGNSVFFPAVGWGIGATINDLSVYGCYRSSTIGKSTSMADRLYFNLTRYGVDEFYVSWGYPIRPVKSLIASKQSATAALDTRTGTRTVAAKESIAYDAAWGEATSGTLTVNGTAVSGLSKTGTYAWTPNTSQTNYWKLAYKAGTANYSATFKHLANYAITYANTKGAANSNPAQYNYDSSITFAALPNVTGYVFNGWNPTKIAAGGFGAKTVTAKWAPISYTVKFNANGGSGTMANLAMTYGTAKTLTANAFTRTGYTFKGWATSSGATTAAYTDKQSVNNLTSTANGTVNLYAVWQVNTYSVKFNANGGSGSMTALGCTYGQIATLTANAFTRTGYAFLGWATSASGAVVYKNGVSVKNLSDAANATVNLYAKWTDTWYVNAATGNDTTNEGTSEAEAFKTIQHAIDLTVPGMTIVVADGTYAPINSGNKSITIRSVNGAAKTIIDGGYPAATNRCVYAGGNDGQTNTVIRGFTIQNGCTIGLASLNGAGVAGGTLHDCIVRANHGGQAGGGVAHSQMFECEISDNETENSGGGAYRAYLNNCQLLSNRSKNDGAGAFGGILNNCTIVSNRAELAGGGVCGAVLTNCVVRDNVALSNGGGASGGSLFGCTITNNIAYQNGGGVTRSTIEDCTISGNSAYSLGGGVIASKCTCCEIASNSATLSGGGAGGLSVLDNCVIRDNKALTGNGGGCVSSDANNCTIFGNQAADYGGGVSNEGSHKLVNCIVYGNSAAKGNNAISGGVTQNCCTDDPHFIRAEAGDFRLRCDSPCIDAGNNAYVTNMVDFAGNPRIVNNKVDIGAYEFSASLDRHFTVQVANGTGGAIYYEGDTVTIAAEDRSPRYSFVRWTGDVSVLANANSMTNTFTMPTRNLSFTAEYDDLQSYLVIDLSGGKDATSYPVSYLTDVPAGGWTDTYKTSKLVMRRIDPGTFTMGSPEGEAGRQEDDEPQHQVTLTHSYYIGVFELTQRQWELVMGTRPSAFSNTVCYASRPVEGVSYNQIRGYVLGKWWPQMNTVDEASFMGKLRAKTGRLFDLPTEAQWEYACRAGTTTALNSGKNLVAPAGVDANMAEVGRYYYNSGAYNNSYDYNGTDETGTAKVGSYLPNAWGLYDMHGNVGEYCLDWSDLKNSGALTDPVGPETGSSRAVRSGTWANAAKFERSAGRKLGDSTSTINRGLRPVINFADFSMKKVVNVQASDGTVPEGIRVTWTAVPGTEKYRIFKGLTSNIDDATIVGESTTAEYLSVQPTTDKYWFWVQAKVDGVWGTVSESDTGCRVRYQLTVTEGTGTTNCFANTWVPITANAAPTGYSFKEWTGAAADVALLANKTASTTTLRMPGRAVTLTATYQANAYTVKFNANGGTGTMANESFVYDTAKALTANAFTRTGYTFKGWAMTASGAVAHADKASVKNLTATANGTVNLYAVWQANAYTVKFNANGGSGTMANLAMTYDTAKTLTANAFTRTGYTFQGWATSASGAVAHADKASVKNLTAAANGMVNLHAVWTANPYTVTFDANGGEGSAMGTQDFAYGTAQNLPAVGYARTGYTFLGWSTNPKATAAMYADGASVSNLATGGTLKLYAVWRPNTCTVRFLPNGAAGTMADQKLTYDTAAKLTANAFTKAGFGFVGWCAEGETAVGYTNRQEVINLATDDGAVVTLAAKWADTWYVDATAGNDANEGVAPDQAFQTIQHAIDQSVDGMTILVADGTYASFTAERGCVIRGVPGTIVAGSVGLVDGSVLESVRVQNGDVTGGTLTNCIITGGCVRQGTAQACEIRACSGFAAEDATLENCVVSATVGGLKNCVATGCTITDNTAGGATNSVLHGCVIRGNTASAGGGLVDCVADNCLIVGNTASSGDGGGALRCSLSQCTVYGNVAAHAGGGSSGGTNDNCIVYGNTAASEPNISSSVTKRNCFTGDPLFVDAANGDFRLQGASPCIDMGNNRYVVGETDIRGNARIQNGVVDLGAYEYTLPTELGNVPVEGTDVAVPVEWLGLYGYVDEDATPASLQAVLKQTGDNGVPLWESWVAGFDPWDPDSQLTAEIEMVDGEPVVSWTPDMSAAEPKRHYTVMGKTNLTDAAWIIPVNEAHRFFKVQVTMGEPGRVTEVAATAGTSADGVTLSWRAADWALGYNVYRATVDDFDRATLVASVSDAAYVDTTAVPGVEYHYWIVSVANGGEWLTSEGAVGHRGIGVPQRVMASDGTATDWITVTWEAVDGAVSYRVLRATSDAVADAVVVGTSAGTSWMDRAAECGTVYTYWVVAVGVNISGEASASDEGYLRLLAPTDVTASNGAYADRIRIAWAEVPAASHYRVYRSSAASGSKTPISSWQTARTYSDTTAEAGQTYYYFVSAALDGEGLNASAYSTGAVGGLKVGTPTGVYATDGTSSTGVTVSWQAVVGADGYTVYRGTANDPAAAQVLTTTATTSFEDTTAEPGTLYFYWVEAVNAVSASEKSAGETGFRSLGAPTGVTATTQSGAAAVTVSWQPVAGAVSYRVFRGTRSGEAYAVEIDSTTETSYADESVAAGRTYYYSVIAVGATCESGFSAFAAGSR